MEDVVVHIQGGGWCGSRSSSLDRLRPDLLGNRVGEGVQRGELALCKGGFQGDVVADELHVLHGGNQLAHDLAAGGGPAAVLNEGDLALLQVVRGEIVEEVLHRDKHARVIGRGREDQVAAAERVGDNVARRGDGGVIHADLNAALRELGGEDVRSVLRVAVDGGVGEHDALFLRSVAAPEQVLLQEVAEMAAPDKAVQRADGVDLESGSLFQDGLHLGTVFADDVGVVAAGLVDVFNKEVGLVIEQAAVERAEGAEGVGSEQGLVRQVVGHHDFRPVDHRRHDEGQLMAADGDDVAFLDQVDPVGPVGLEELRQHGLDLRIADDAGLGIAQQQAVNGGGVVRLHMGDDQIVQLPPAELVGDVLKEDLIHGLVNRVEQNGFFIQHQVGVIADAVGNAVHTLKAGEAAVIGADPDQIVIYLSCAIHICSFLSAERTLQ